MHARFTSLVSSAAQVHLCFALQALPKEATEGIIDGKGNTPADSIVQSTKCLDKLTSGLEAATECQPDTSTPTGFQRYLQSNMGTHGDYPHKPAHVEDFGSALRRAQGAMWWAVKEVTGQALAPFDWGRHKIMQLTGQVSDVTHGAVSDLEHKLHDASSGAKHGVHHAAESVRHATDQAAHEASGAAGKVQHGLQGTAQNIKHAVEQTAADLKDGVCDAAACARWAADSSAGKVHDRYCAVVCAAQHAAGSVVNGVKGAVQHAAGSARRAAQSAAHKAQEGSHKVVDSVEDAVNQGLHASAEAAYTTGNNTKAAYAKMLQQLHGLSSLLKGAGHKAERELERDAAAAQQKLTEGLEGLQAAADNLKGHAARNIMFGRRKARQGAERLQQQTQQASDKLQQVGRDSYEGAKDAVDHAAEGSKHRAEGVVDRLKQVIRSITGSGREGHQVAQDSVEDAANAAGQMGQQGWRAAKGAAQDAVDQMVGVSEHAKDRVQDAARQTLHDTSKKAKRAAKTAQRDATGAAQYAQEQLGDAAEHAKQKAEDTSDQAYASAKGYAEGIWGRVAGTVSWLGSTLSGSRREMIADLNGMRDSASYQADRAKAWGEGAADQAKQAAHKAADQLATELEGVAPRTPRGGQAARGVRTYGSIQNGSQNAADVMKTMLSTSAHHVTHTGSMVRDVMFAPLKLLPIPGITKGKGGGADQGSKLWGTIRQDGSTAGRLLDTAGSRVKQVESELGHLGSKAWQHVSSPPHQHGIAGHLGSLLSHNGDKSPSYADAAYYDAIEKLKAAAEYIDKMKEYLTVPDLEDFHATYPTVSEKLSEAVKGAEQALKSAGHRHQKHVDTQAIERLCQTAPGRCKWCMTVQCKLGDMYMPERRACALNFHVIPCIFIGVVYWG